MPTIEEIISDVIRREGPATNDPDDRGGRTAYGISERANPEAWADGVVTEAEAREIYERKYVKWPGFDKVSNIYLKAQLVDFGVNSGPALATMKLQEILNTYEWVNPKLKVDGALGPKSLNTMLQVGDAKWLNNQLVAARIKMLGRIVSKNPSQLKYINGWLNRALEFLI
jgi:lysozyme family protein